MTIAHARYYDTPFSTPSHLKFVARFVRVAVKIAAVLLHSKVSANRLEASTIHSGFRKHQRCVLSKNML